MPVLPGQMLSTPPPPLPTTQGFANQDKFGMLPPPPGVKDERLRGTLAERQAQLAAFVSETQSKLAAVARDKGLNHQGRADRRRRILADAADAIEKLAGLSGLASPAAQLRRETERAVSRLAPERRLYEDFTGEVTTPRPKRPDEALLHREIRDRLLALTEEERTAIAMKAATTNDLPTLRAIAGAPESFPVLPKEKWQAVDARHMELHHAEEILIVAENRSALDHLHFNAAQARKALGLEAADTEPQIVGGIGFDE